MSARVLFGFLLGISSVAVPAIAIDVDADLGREHRRPRRCWIQWRFGGRGPKRRLGRRSRGRRVLSGKFGMG